MKNTSRGARGSVLTVGEEQSKEDKKRSQMKFRISLTIRRKKRRTGALNATTRKYSGE
jgi:hypothetical protein